MTTLGIVWGVVAAWLALQIPIGILVGHCIRRTQGHATVRIRVKSKSKTERRRHPHVAAAFGR